MKEVLKKYLWELSESCEDLGPQTFDPDDDFPDYAIPLAQKVSEESARGILLCRSAIGVCIVANKFRGIRAGIGYSVDAARSAREHDDTNVLCVPGSLQPEEAREIVKAWLATPFSGADRHVRRIAKIATIEQERMK